MTSETETNEAIVAANERIMSTFGQADAAGMAVLHRERGQLAPPDALIIVRELTLQMAQAVVTHPERVRVEATAGVSIIVLDLRVDPEDMGRVIGKEGRVANAMRTLLRVLGGKQGKRVTLEIVESGAEEAAAREVAPIEEEETASFEAEAVEEALSRCRQTPMFPRFNIPLGSNTRLTSAISRYASPSWYQR